MKLAIGEVLSGKKSGNKCVFLISNMRLIRESSTDEKLVRQKVLDSAAIVEILAPVAQLDRAEVS